jgi:hypothetical protein
VLNLSGSSGLGLRGMAVILMFLADGCHHTGSQPPP